MTLKEAIKALVDYYEQAVEKGISDPVAWALRQALKEVEGCSL